MAEVIEAGQSRSRLDVLLDNDFFRERMWEGGGMAGRTAGLQRIRAEAGEFPESIESALEAAFWFLFYGAQLALLEPHRRTTLLYKLMPQYWVECSGRRYRLDFRVAAVDKTGLRPLNLAIELDGHTYHERTPAQVDARNTRDSDLQALGFRVLHFSFNQIANDGQASGYKAVGVACDCDPVRPK